MVVAGVLFASPSVALQEFADPVALTSSLPTTLLPTFLDADGDGVTDLVSINGEQVYVFRGVQGLEFELGEVLPLDLGAGNDASAVGASDVDGDGDLDLFVRSSARLVVFENVAGTGIALSPMEIHDLSTASPYEESLQFRDIDGDGLTDVHGSHRFRAFDLSFNNPEWIALRRGSSYELQNLDAPVSVRATRFADVTGDGLEDVILGGRDSLFIRQQVTPGIFSPATQFGAGTQLTYIQRIVTDDLDGDGDQDALVLHAPMNVGPATLTAFENTDGAGTFAFQSVVYESSGPFLDVEFLDADNDGDRDLVAQRDNFTQNPLQWLERESGPFAFASAATVPTSGGFFPGWLMALTDLTGDGLVDLFFGGNVGYSAVISEAQPAGTLYLGGEYHLISSRLTAFGLESISPIDYDGDGDFDVAFSGEGNDEVLWISINKGPGRFDTPSLFNDEQGGVHRFTVGDVDGDGDDDIVLHRDNEIAWKENLGGGEFVERLVQSSIITKSPGPILVDFDGDGDLDVIGHAASGTTLYVLEQEPTGSFRPARDLILASRTLRSAAFFDMDHDGDLDVALGQSQQANTRSRILLYERTGPYTFGPPLLIPSAGVRATSVSMIDVTGDGVQELVWLASPGGRIRASAVMAQGGLSVPFTVATTVGEGRSIVGVPSRTGGGQDLVVGTDGIPTDRLEYVRWTGNPGYDPAVIITDQIEEAAVLHAADFDLDGDVDLLAGPSPVWLASLRVPAFGDPGCGAAVPNSTGRIAQMTAIGSDLVAADNVTLIGTDMPGNSLVTFLCSLAPAEVLTAGGTLGTLCLGGEIGRFYGPGQAGLTNADGRRDVEINLAAFPQPMGSVPVLAGQRWYFQGWHRDSIGGAAVANFTASTSVMFR